MAFALEPGELGKVVLKKHEGQTDAPYCVVAALSVRQKRNFTTEYDEAFRTVKTTGEYFDTLKNVFNKYVKSIHGYSSNDPEEAFTDEGMGEILSQLVRGTVVSYEEKKSCELPHLFDAASFVISVPKITAKTPTYELLAQVAMKKVV
jgi:hypothetical protein